MHFAKLEIFLKIFVTIFYPSNFPMWLVVIFALAMDETLTKLNI